MRNRLHSSTWARRIDEGGWRDIREVSIRERRFKVHIRGCLWRCNAGRKLIGKEI